MKTLLFKNNAKTIHLEVIVDAIKENDEMVIMQVNGLTDDIVKLGFNEMIRPTTMTSMVKMAEELNLNLEIHETGKAVKVVIDDADAFDLDTDELPGGTIHGLYVGKLEFTGGNLSAPENSSVEYVELGTTLPDGVQFNENTLSLEGIPEETGTFSIEAVITDSLGDTADVDLEFEIFDCSLSDIKVGDTSIDGFESDQLDYDVELDYGTSSVPTITATATEAGDTTVTVTPAEKLPGTTTVKVTLAADDKVFLVYKVNLTVAESAS